MALAVFKGGPVEGLRTDALPEDGSGRPEHIVVFERLINAPWGDAANGESGRLTVRTARVVYVRPPVLVGEAALARRWTYYYSHTTEET